MYHGSSREFNTIPREFWGVRHCAMGVLGSSVLYHGSSEEFSVVPREFWGVPYYTTGVLGSSVLYHRSSRGFSIVPREFWEVQYCITGVLGGSVLYHGSSGEFSIVPREFWGVQCCFLLERTSAFGVFSCFSVVFCWSEPQLLVSSHVSAEQGQFLPVPIPAYVGCTALLFLHRICKAESNDSPQFVDTSDCSK